MKRLFCITILILVLCIGTIMPLAQVSATEDPGIYSWTGQWKTNWGDMTLTQTGAKVTGTYTFDSGKIEGTVSGNTLTGTWSESPSYAPPRDAGEVEFVMSADGKSFSGKWRYGSEGDWGGWDGGTRDSVALLEAPKSYEKASSWATAELEKADDAGLIPDILKGADLTKPITREEFCELALLLYEKSTGKSPAAASPNPFTDTKNPKVLKAFALGITTGTSATVFSPQVLINREQCATMLYRALRVIAPEGGYSIAGIKDFPDQKNISAYAVEGTKYMSKLGIIKGDNNGNFMPKATTTAQEATGYGAATREASILMSVRSYDQIESGALGTPTGDGSATPPLDTGSNAVSYSFRGAIEDSKTSSAAAPEATVPAPDPAKESGELAEWLIGTWGYSNSGGWGSNAHLEMMYEFKKDGTFYKVLAPMISGARTGNVFEGKYKISGDKLTLYDQLKSVGPAKSYFDKIWYFEMESYDTKDVPVEDSEYKISRTDEGTLIMDDVEFERGR